VVDQVFLKTQQELVVQGVIVHQDLDLVHYKEAQYF
tara:strand:+ start:75 stop:182 length:108 start_codon:yes stop_codon:yes gene_type:complete